MLYRKRNLTETNATRVCCFMLKQSRVLQTIRQLDFVLLCVRKDTLTLTFKHEQNKMLN